jgi:hypothetical protein
MYIYIYKITKKNIFFFSKFHLEFDSIATRTCLTRTPSLAEKKKKNKGKRHETDRNSNRIHQRAPYQIGDQHFGSTHKLGCVESLGHIVASRCHQDGHHTDNGQQVGIDAVATEGARLPRCVVSECTPRSKRKKSNTCVIRNRFNQLDAHVSLQFIPRLAHAAQRTRVTFAATETHATNAYGIEIASAINLVTRNHHIY